MLHLAGLIRSVCQRACRRFALLLDTRDGCGSVCVPRQLWPRTTSSCVNSWPCTRNVRANLGALLMPRVVSEINQEPPMNYFPRSISSSL